MKYYQIIETDKKYNEDEIACYYNPKSFDGNIMLDRKTPIKKNPFITFYYVKNIYDHNMSCLEDENNKIIILLKKDEKDIYTIDGDGYVLGDNFVNHLYSCVDNELGEKINRIGSIIIKENYNTHSLFERSIRLEDNQMEIGGYYNFGVNFFDDVLIGFGIDGCLKINYNGCVITTDNYTKVDSNNITNILFDILVTMENYIIVSKDELYACIEEFVNILEKKYGKTNNIFMINETGISESNGLFDGISLFIETKKKLVVITSGIFSQ